MPNTTLLVEDELAIESLPWPDKDPDYVAAVEKLTKLESDQSGLSEAITILRQELEEFHVDDLDSSKVLAEKGMELDVMLQQSQTMRDLIASQKDAVVQAQKAAKRTFAREAKKVWVDEYIPTLLDLMDRLFEINAVYRRLKNASGGPFNPPFPLAIEQALGRNDYWPRSGKKHFSANTLDSFSRPISA